MANEELTKYRARTLSDQGYDIYRTPDGGFVTVVEDRKGFRSKVPVDELVRQVNLGLGDDYQPYTVKPVKEGASKKEQRGGYGLRQKTARNISDILGEGTIDEHYRQKASEASWLDKAGVHLSHEINKLGAGTENAIDWGQIIAGGDMDKNVKQIVERQNEQAEIDRRYRPYDKLHPTKLAKMLPYIASGGIEPLVTRAMGKGLSLIGRGGATVLGKGADVTGREAKRTGGVIKKSYQENIKDKIPRAITDKVSKTSDEIAASYRKNVTDPIQSHVSHFKNRPYRPDPMHGSPVPELLSSASLGAVEGGLHYDDTVSDGVLSSVIGTLGGRGIRNKVSQAHEYNPTPTTEFLDRMYIEGLTPDAGMRTGIPEIQVKMDNMRKSGRTSSGMRHFDDVNEEVLTRKIAKAAGMDKNQLRNITRKELAEHVANTKKKYEHLESLSSGYFDDNSFDKIIYDLDGVPESVSKDVMRYIDKLEPGFSGKDYKTQRAEIKNKADNAYKNNLDHAFIYKELLSTLDGAMKRGVSELDPSRIGKNPITGQPFKPDEIASMWEKLNENYAMTDLMVRKGMNPEGGVDPKGILEHVMSKDTHRFLTGRGGEIGEFHDVAFWQHLKNKGVQGGLGADSLTENRGNDIMFTPAVGDMTAGDRAALFLNTTFGYPSKTGTLGLPRKGAFSAPNLLRAEGQATDVWPDLIANPAMQGMDYVNDLYTNLMYPDKEEK